MNQWYKSTISLVNQTNYTLIPLVHTKLIILLYHWFIPYKVERGKVSFQTKLMVLLYHWFIPYKVERGKVSFQPLVHPL